MKKIFYVPGLISAILIPVLFWYYGNQKFEEINLNVIDIWLPPKNESGKEASPLSFEPYRNWNYKKIKIEPSTAKQNSKLYVSELKNLQKRNEKESGIEFILDQNSTYGDFVSVLNDLAIAKQDQYAVDLEKSGHIFAVYSYVDPNAQPLEYECLLCNDTIDWGPAETVNIFESTRYGKIFNLFTTVSKETSYLIFGFLIFLNISMLSIKEKFQLYH
ncbi:hypothetical protein SAMN06265171_11163 [Chryseobacterium rhizoplanae]|uniref:Uncharacterized protein n=1 Tax=Chryseobacterium rhizoplanae TaxID=1609531 RepID=A0A521F2N1_9FLAO|nr:hypothetical protein [Chryseobacterium rhizoplanae]SMO90425.1 hypothetical protein SAMN06265171_11163 [Chryseobacterium rhizoplanae]